ncbi:hypothetical protein HU200_025957 [Digitaria exilis]|uniref:Non-specific lipid-transfer protein n=1 Tax=Digitaria exilis TaxID=1010633 RepID=A0A835EVT4_9POAL|nr:hypothetical protein HU200_025957 [Digitaria exilis]
MAAPRLATVAVAVLVAAAVVAPPAAVRAAMSCSTVYNTLMPCLPYVQMGGAMPPRPCCGGIRSLLAQANNTPDRRTICGCLKNVANGASGGTYVTRATELPTKCGVTLPYKISTGVNCNTYEALFLSSTSSSIKQRATVYLSCCETIVVL